MYNTDFWFEISYKNQDDQVGRTYRMEEDSENSHKKQVTTQGQN